MTKREYEWFHWWDRRVKVGRVVKMCPSVIKILPLEYPSSSWEIQRFPSRVIKIKSDAIPED